jgi:PRTRC genetic system protein B
MATRDLTHVEAAGDETLALRSALLLYATSDQRRAYATVHDVLKGRGGMQLGPGRPASREGLAEFATALAGDDVADGWVSDRILYIGRRVTAWYEPHCLQRVFFDTEHADPTRNIGKRDAIVAHPAMVHALTPDGWYVWIVANDETRPAPGDALYRAPYFNAYADGRICEGNVLRPAKATTGTLPAFKGAFFGSRFTHPNEQRASTLTRYRGGLYALWRDLLDSRITDIPATSWVRHGTHTLRTAIEALERGKLRDDH